MSDFEEYVAGRGPALVAFAVLVTGRDDEARRLAQNALGRALGHWASVVHDEDPDAHLRRDVVAEAARVTPWAAARATRSSRVGAERGRDQVTDLWRRWVRLPVLTRATLALRYVEERSWPEVSWTTGLSERATRRRAEQGLAALAPGLGGAAGVAGSADCWRRRHRRRLARPAEGRAARADGGRPDRPGGAVLARGTSEPQPSRAAAAWGRRALLVAAVGVPLLVSVWPGPAGLVDLDPSPDDGTTLETVLPEGFRTEAWRGVEVGVPSGWGYGSLTGWCRDGGLATPRVEPGRGTSEPADCDPGLAPGVQFRLGG